jgi:hypothetical protein
VELEVQRQTPQGDGIAGELLVDAEPECLTLENAHVCIPPGRYRVTLFQSPRFGRRVPLLHDVPDRSAIEMHPGNLPRDTRGCIIVGTFPIAGGVGGSAWALTALVKRIDGALARQEDVWITVKAPPEAPRPA